jgi:hypothetical protein
MDVKWDRPPDAVVYYRKTQVYAVFRWAEDALLFVKHLPAYTQPHVHIETTDGRRVTGVDGHGNAVFAKTEQKETADA